jgi:hypothetical protein
MVVLKFWRSILFGLFILTICLMPSAEVKKLDFLQMKYEDLFIHFGMFLIFSFLLANDFLRTLYLNDNPILKFIIVLVISIILGFSTELLQYLILIINRSANLFDFLFDLAGSFVGITLIRLIKR